MKNGKSVSDIRYSNRALLLERLYTGGAASRKHLSELCGLTAASVTQLSSQLISEGVLEETGKMPPQGRTGRSEQLLDINRSGLYVVGVNVTEHGIELKLSDLKLQLIKSAWLPMNADAFTSGELCAAISSLIKGLESKTVGVGISIRGSVDPLRGVSLDSYGLLPKDFALAEPLGKHLRLPVSVDSSVRAMLTTHELSDPFFAEGVVLFIEYGPGIGGALLENGSHFLGARFNACNVGHICVQEGGAPCVCGRRGCLETILSFEAVESAAKSCFSEKETPLLYALCEGSLEKLTAAAVYESFSRGDEGVAKLLEKPLGAFSAAIAECEALFDPDLVILCSEFFEYHQLCGYLEKEISARVGNLKPYLRFITGRSELAAKSAAAVAIRAFIKSGAPSSGKE